LLGSFSRDCWLVQHHQLYSGLGADIVMESIALKTPDFGEEKAHACHRTSRMR
jgi:hypothetical protein